MVVSLFSFFYVVDFVCLDDSCLLLFLEGGRGGRSCPFYGAVQRVYCPLWFWRVFLIKMVVGNKTSEHCMHSKKGAYAVCWWIANECKAVQVITGILMDLLQLWIRQRWSLFSVLNTTVLMWEWIVAVMPTNIATNAFAKGYWTRAVDVEFMKT